MKRNWKRYVLSCLWVLPFMAQSQRDSATDRTSFKLGIFYNTHLNYYGRTDSLNSSGFFPLAEIGLGKNFYVNAAPVFVNNSMVSFQYAGTVSTVGYRFSHENKLNGNIYFVKPFYKSNSQLVESALKAQLAASFTSRNKLINLTMGGDVKFSEQIDFGVNAALDHLFRFNLPEFSFIVIDPTASVNVGTQQFRKSYYKQSNFLILPGVEQSVNESVNNFTILAYEFSAPIVYGKEKWQLILIPAYVVPKNLLTVANRPDLSEKGQNMFYATLGAKITL